VVLTVDFEDLDGLVGGAGLCKKAINKGWQLTGRCAYRKALAVVIQSSIMLEHRRVNTGVDNVDPRGREAHNHILMEV